MSWSSACLSLVLASSPPPQRWNAEPIGFAISGLIVAGVGAWRLGVAELHFQSLKSIDPQKITSAADADRELARARSLKEAGQLETSAGFTLIAVGATFAVASTIWFLIEGPTTRNWWVNIGPQGVAFAAQF